MRTELLTEDEAYRLIKPHSDLIIRSVRQAFADWAAILAASPQETGGLTHRTRRPFFHERIIHQLAIAETNGLANGLRVRKVRNLNVAIINDRILLKVKKLDGNYRSRNIRTGQTARFDAQQPLIKGQDLRLTHATSGYIEDEAGAEPIDVVVTCWNNESHLWTLHLGPDTGGGAPVIELDAGPLDDTSIGDDDENAQEDQEDAQ